MTKGGSGHRESEDSLYFIFCNTELYKRNKPHDSDPVYLGVHSLVLLNKTVPRGVTQVDVHAGGSLKLQEVGGGEAKARPPRLDMNRRTIIGDSNPCTIRMEKGWCYTGLYLPGTRRKALRRPVQNSPLYQWIKRTVLCAMREYAQNRGLLDHHIEKSILHWHEAKIAGWRRRKNAWFVTDGPLHSTDANLIADCRLVVTPSNHPSKETDLDWFLADTQDP
ncbi:uncharacterized protein FOMMEDRAFT_161226 [Fomitiporia mediterranea MF3/22]|uniref:uncharacterized protein n=1 Tax=Fomitiporia mediterranea (strain MF3/22) TaxID=694068 RepID=UPI0004408065|nr:uncharacterized protein FOMMEDRAFT_161226 [Fomitiporia mediterranea MF3/22]EJC99016.1 hypothetical protein FOMMEDRAFT_161226 [Fomitiporia mediterranea MF3/22]